MSEQQKQKKSLSDMEFFKSAMKLRQSITELLCRDFGILKQIDTSNQLYTEPQLSEKQHSNDFPQWIIDHERAQLMGLTADMMHYLVVANTIKISDEATFMDRRHYQTMAIACCETIIQELQYIIYCFPVDAESLLPHVDDILHEIYLLRRWRESDTRAVADKRKKELEDYRLGKSNDLRFGFIEYPEIRDEVEGRDPISETQLTGYGPTKLDQFGTFKFKPEIVKQQPAKAQVPYIDPSSITNAGTTFRNKFSR